MAHLDLPRRVYCRTSELRGCCDGVHTVLDAEPSRCNGPVFYVVQIHDAAPPSVRTISVDDRQTSQERSFYVLLIIDLQDSALMVPRKDISYLVIASKSPISHVAITVNVLGLRLSSYLRLFVT